MPGPLYHNGPFMWTTTALLAGNHVVLGGRFDAERTLAADRPVPPRLDVRRADDDGAHLEAAARGARPLRRVVAEGRVAPRGAVPAVVEGRVDRLARRRDDLGAVRAAPRRRPRRSSTASSGWSTAARSARSIPRSSRSCAPTAPTPIPARSARCSCGRRPTRACARTATSAPRRGASTAGGSRSATWA